METVTVGAVVSRKCDECGEKFCSKNDKAAFMMATGRLRVCDECRRGGGNSQLTYSEYIQSDAWRMRRLRALELAEHHCQLCGGSTALEVHHNTYRRMGAERDADLVVLCHDCHMTFHDRQVKV